MTQVITTCSQIELGCNQPHDQQYQRKYNTVYNRIAGDGKEEVKDALKEEITPYQTHFRGRSIVIESASRHVKIEFLCRHLI